MNRLYRCCCACVDAGSGVLRDAWASAIHDVVLVSTGARGTAKTHLPTDEASLKQLQLATGHELPGLVLEYR
jgi:hypothetical protein